ncbi:MAG TPA: 4Fe-4S binding protein [Methanocellales archaeon]|nr:4Fe-4S binding protein [Methanocellales archaeon]
MKMGRRKFLKSIAFAGAIATRGFSGCVSEPEPTPAPSMPTRTAPTLPATAPPAPKGIICYYSASGNTKLACQYIANKIKSAKFDLFDIVKEKSPDLDKYAVVGLATFADFWSVPYYFCSFLEKLGPHTKKHAFVFNTYGSASGKTLIRLKNMAEKNGFNVVAGYSLHTPESYPPLRARGSTFDDSPDENELEEFNEFISRFDNQLKSIQEGNAVNKEIKISFLSRILQELPRTQARKDMGEKYVDESLCIECGVCKSVCPYGAIQLKPKPVFDMDKCFGCWACYNHCTEKAIYTKKYKGTSQYPKPSK